MTIADTSVDERQAKIDRIIASLAGTPEGLALLDASLGRSGLGMMKVISKDSFPSIDDPVRLSLAKRGLILDTETTGVDTSSDEIIELAMVEFFYDDRGIIRLGDVYDEFNEPRKKAIDEEVSALTGITNEMVAGKSINPADVKAMVSGADIVLAHHAAFDRKIVENNLPGCGFENVRWHCSVNQIEWIKRGKTGRSLEVLALSEGLIYGSHRADADCLATGYVLMHEDQDGRTAFAELLATGDIDTVMVIADKSPFDTKDVLKERGYRWSADGSEAFGYKAWYTEIPATPERMAEEAEFLKEKIYRKDVALPQYEISARTRYSDRKPSAKGLFRTREARDLHTHSAQLDLEDHLGLGT